MGTINWTPPPGWEEQTGAHISFKAPCNSSSAGDLKIGDNTYTFMDTSGSRVNNLGYAFISGAMVEAVLDCDQSRAYIISQGGSANAWNYDTLPVSSGTWTPSGTGISSASGSYYRIGNLVTVWGKCTVTSSTSTNALAISGLPYTCNSNTDSVAGTIGRTSNMVVYTGSAKTTKVNYYFPVVSAGGTSVYFVVFFDGRSYSNISYSVVNSGNVNFFLTYFI